MNCNKTDLEEFAKNNFIFLRRPHEGATANVNTKIVISLKSYMGRGVKMFKIFDTSFVSNILFYLLQGQRGEGVSIQ